jgi:hypothetical protein
MYIIVIALSLPIDTPAILSTPTSQQQQQHHHHNVMISENSIQQLVDRLARLEYIITQSLDTKNKRRNNDVIDEELNINRYNTNFANDDHNDNDNKNAYKDGTDNSDSKKDNYVGITDDKVEYNYQHHDDDIADDGDDNIDDGDIDVCVIEDGDINNNKGGIQYYGYDDDYYEDTDVEEDKDYDFDDVFTHHTRNITTTKVTFNDDTIINTLHIDHDEVHGDNDHDNGNDEDVGGNAADLDDDYHDDDDDNDFINPLMSMYEQSNHADIKNNDNLDDMMVDDQYHNHNELFHPNYTNNSFIHNHIKIPSLLSNNNDTNNRRNSEKLMKIIPQSASSSLDTMMMIVDTSINDFDVYIQDCISEYNGDDSNIVVGDDDDDDDDNCDVYDDGYDDNDEIDNTENGRHHDDDVFNEVNDDVSDNALRDVIDGYDHADDDDDHADDDSNVNVRYV